MRGSIDRAPGAFKKMQHSQGPNKSQAARNTRKLLKQNQEQGKTTDSACPSKKGKVHTGSNARTKSSVGGAQAPENDRKSHPMANRQNEKMHLSSSQLIDESIGVVGASCLNTMNSN